MNKFQQQVRDFQIQVCELDIPTTPSLIDYATTRLCIRLISEELHELIEAMWKNGDVKSKILTVSEMPGLDIKITNFHEDKYVDIADGIADLLYVVLYTANCYGIDMEPIFDEVQRSNMTKVGGTKDAHGKLIKPSTYSPADLYPILMEQINGKS